MRFQFYFKTQHLLKWSKSLICKLLIIISIFISLNKSTSGQAISATCGAANQITVNSVTGTVTVAGAAGAPALTGCGAPTIINEGWFYFTATTAYSVVTFSNLGTETAYVFIYTGVCGGLGEMKCMSITTGNINLVNFNTVVGQKYYIRIIKTGAAALTGRVGVYSNSGTNAMLCTPDKIAYSTGSVNVGNTKYDNNNIISGIYSSLSNYSLGWAKFNTTNLPQNNITINGVTFILTCQIQNMYDEGFGGDKLVIIPMKNPTLDPVTTTGTNLYMRCNTCRNYYSPFTGYAPFTNGNTYPFVLNSNAPTDFQTNYTQGWFGISVPVAWESPYLGTSEYVQWYGWNSQYTPYLVVTYTPNGCQAPLITYQPTSPSSLCSPAAANFSIAVDGTPSFTYQWQYNNSGTWTNLTDGGTSPVYSGTASAILQVSNATASFDYRCIITNCSGANSVTSNTATLSTCTTGTTPTQTSSNMNR